MKRIIMVLLPCILVSCSYPTYYLSEADKRFDFSGKESFITYLSTTPTLSDRNNLYLLEEVLKSQGFNIVKNFDSADFAITLAITQDAQQFNSTILLPSYSSTSGSINNKYFYANTSSTQAIPYSYTLKAERYYMYVFSMERIKQQDTIPVWIGYAGVDVSQSKADKKDVINKLILNFGKDYDSQKTVTSNKYNRRN